MIGSLDIKPLTETSKISTAPLKGIKDNGFKDNIFKDNIVSLPQELEPFIIEPKQVWGLEMPRHKLLEINGI